MRKRRAAIQSLPISQKRLHLCHDVWNRTRNYVCMHYLPRNDGEVGRIEVPLLPKRRQRKAVDIPEGSYRCDAFGVEKTGKCNKVVLRICYKGEIQFVYRSGIQVAVWEIGGIEWLRCM